MMKYWFLSGQGLQARARSFVWGNAGHSVSWSQSIILTGNTKEKKKEGREKKSDLGKLQQGHQQSGCTGLQTERGAHISHWLQLIWILMMCLLSGNSQQITADRITVGVAWTENEDLGERVYILFKQHLAGVAERDSGNVLCYNSVVVPLSRSNNRLANGKPSITISLLFHQCLHFPQLCEREQQER